jgi:hypothetical protein
MKFYKDNNDGDMSFWTKIQRNKLTAIYINVYISEKTNLNEVIFFENGKFHNNKNIAIINIYYEYKKFYFNGMFYGNEDDFTKKSWRKFVKLKAFL